jgi:hypothetical protein
VDNFQRLGVAENKVSEQEIAEDVLRFRCLKERQKRISVSALVYLLLIFTTHSTKNVLRFISVIVSDTFIVFVLLCSFLVSVQVILYCIYIHIHTHNIYTYI